MDDVHEAIAEALKATINEMDILMATQSQSESAAASEPRVFQPAQHSPRIFQPANVSDSAIGFCDLVANLKKLYEKKVFIEKLIESLLTC